MTKKWFWIGIAGIFIFSLVLRFWQLERFNTLVFDEVYYAKFAHKYLNNIRFFDGHPPLGKYIITIGMWLGDYLPFGKDTINGFTGAMRSPWSYRWINALFGAFIPPIVIRIAYELSRRRGFALLAGLFTACDGIFLVESRYALINQYLVIFGLLGQLCLLLALNSYHHKRTIWLVLSGIAFGASAATKWNGLFFLLAVYLLWAIVWLFQFLSRFNFKNLGFQLGSYLQRFLELGFIKWLWYLLFVPHRLDKARDVRYFRTGYTHPLQNLTEFGIGHMVIFLGVVPAIVYSVLWIPHLLLDTRFGFIEVHQRIWQFHHRLGGNNEDVHPYCAAWYKWPLMMRPIAYFYQRAQTVEDPLPVMGPHLNEANGKIIYDVHAMGNPLLWWLGLVALLFLVIVLIAQILIPWFEEKHFPYTANFNVDIWIALYLVVNYVANLLPWVTVTRCVFIYHYMSAVIFVFMALAWLVECCISSFYKETRALGVTLTFLVIAAFIFWLPLYLGLPLSPEDYKLKMLFDSWI